MSQCALHTTSGISCDDRGCHKVLRAASTAQEAIGRLLPSFEPQLPTPVPASEPMPTPATPSGPPSKPIKWFDGLFEHPGLTVYDVAVGSYLYRRAGKSLECWPKQEQIARACHMTRKAVRAAVARLVKLGMIESNRRRRRASEGRITSTSNKYKLLPPESWHRSTRRDPLLPALTVVAVETKQWSPTTAP